MASCGGSSGNNTSEDGDNQSATEGTPEDGEEQKYTEAATVEVRGKQYKYTIDFHEIDSLPHYTDLQGVDYPDHGATVTISNDTTVLFVKSFTKFSFKSYIPEKIFKNSGLVSFAYNALQRELKHNNALYFIASIGSLDDPEETPYMLDVQIQPDGSMAISHLTEEDMTAGINQLGGE